MFITIDATILDNSSISFIIDSTFKMSAGLTIPVSFKRRNQYFVSFADFSAII